jgi:hypothetical protein
MALLLGSPAIDAGTVTGAPTTDQRGALRDAHPDIGAFEVTTADRSVVTLSPSSVAYGETATVTMQAKDDLGNNLHSGGLTVAFGLGAGTSAGSLGTVSDNHDGTYTATFTATAPGTARTITATINGMVVTTTLPTVTVTPRPITVMADAKTKFYGDADPTLTYQVTSGSLAFTDAFSGGPSRVTGETVGSYAIQQGTLALSSNYALTYVAANLTITARPVTVTADAKTKFYGDADPTLTYQVTSGSLAFTDAFSGGLSRVTGETVGNYAIQQGTLALSSNYALTYVAANLTITARPVTVTADAETKVYGTPDPALSYQITSGSLAFTDAFSGRLTRVAGENVGPYAIQQGTLALSSNYTLTYVGASLTITPAPLSATGVDISVTAGAPFSGTVATFTNADPFGSAASYTAAITRGDGSTSAGVITGTGSTLTVTGAHTYAAPVSETVQVTISHNLGNTTTATTTATATVNSLGQGVQDDQTRTIAVWHYDRGQDLIASFNGGAGHTELSTWLATNFANLYGASAGSHDLTGQTNEQVAAFFQSLFNDHDDEPDVQVLATALNVYATTASLGGAQGHTYGFRVTAEGLGASSFTIHVRGAPHSFTLNVYQALQVVNQRAVGGVLFDGDPFLRDLAEDVFQRLNDRGA